MENTKRRLKESFLMNIDVIHLFIDVISFLYSTPPVVISIPRFQSIFLATSIEFLLNIVIEKRNDECDSFRKAREAHKKAKTLEPQGINKPFGGL